MQHVLIAIGSLSTRLTFAINFVHLALKLMQDVLIAIVSPSTRLTFAINFVHLVLKLMQHITAIAPKSRDQ